jgi:hypothetical protein
MFEFHVLLVGQDSKIEGYSSVIVGVCVESAHVNTLQTAPSMFSLLTCNRQLNVLWLNSEMTDVKISHLMSK